MVIAVRDVVDAVKMLGEVVKNTREVVKAVNDGATYLKRKHPDAKGDVAELLSQMQTTVVGLAEVTKVASSFRFVVSDLSISPASAQRELARFNDYVIEQNAHVARLKANIRGLKGSCEKIRALRDKLDAQAKKGDQGSMFLLLGLKLGAQSRKLHSHISLFYADDAKMIGQIEGTLKFVTKALKDVDEALGPPGIASPYHVPRAAALLGTYAMLLREPQESLDALAGELQAARDALAK